MSDGWTLAERVDELCDRFEAEVVAGQRPQIEAYLADVPAEERLPLLRALLGLEIELRRRAGESPSRDEFRARFPDAAAVIDLVLAEAAAGLSSRRSAESPRNDQRSSAAPPASIGRFQIRQLLGEGAFGSVYRARDPQLDRDVAIKVPRTESLATRAERERFLREARAAAGLHHPFICPVYEVGTTDDGLDYIVMAYIDGKPLSRLLQSNQRMNARQIAAAVRKLAAALDEAHEQGVIHRDLKPGNIMINRKGEPVIMDFGLARREHADDPQLSRSGQIMGTPSYMSPEQARGDAKLLGPATDIYSLGVVLYELLCGRRPFQGTVTEVLGQILHVEPRPPSAFRPDVDPRLQAICLKAIAKEPQDRFASMKAFAVALAEFARSGPLTTTKSSSDTTPEPLADDAASHTQQLARLVEAVSSERDDATERAVPATNQPSRSSRWTYGLAAIALGAIAVAAIPFLTDNQNEPVAKTDNAAVVPPDVTPEPTAIAEPAPEPVVAEDDIPIAPEVMPAVVEPPVTVAKIEPLPAPEPAMPAVPAVAAPVIDPLRQSIEALLQHGGRVRLTGNVAMLSDVGDLPVGPLSPTHVELPKDIPLATSDLQPWLKCPELQVLGLNDNPSVDDQFVSSLTAFRSLAVLDVAGTSVTPTGLQHLRRRLPHCTVRWRAPDDGKPKSKLSDWRPLFNGKDLSGWEFYPKEGIWNVENGFLVGANAPRAGALATTQIYADFELQFDYRFVHPENWTGVIFRLQDGLPMLPEDSDALRLSLIDERSKVTSRWADNMQHGALYGIAPPQRLARRPNGQWNSVSLVADGPRIRVTISGIEVLDLNLDELPEPYRSRPAVKRKSGQIALRNVRGRTEIRNVRIKVLNE